MGKLNRACVVLAALVLAGCGGSDTPEEAAPTSTVERPLPLVKFTPPSDGSPIRVLFTGDSLTGGAYATTADQSFPALVASSLGGPVETVSASGPGQNLATVSGITDVPDNLNLAVIELGTNDLNRTPIVDFAATYTALVDRIREKSPRAALVCVGLWTADGGEYDKAIDSSCRAGGGAFVPVSAIFLPEQYRGPVGVQTFIGLSDDFHPNNEGHKALAGAVLATIPR